MAASVRVQQCCSDFDQMMKRRVIALWQLSGAIGIAINAAIALHQDVLTNACTLAA